MGLGQHIVSVGVLRSSLIAVLSETLRWFSYYALLKSRLVSLARSMTAIFRISHESLGLTLEWLSHVNKVPMWLLRRRRVFHAVAVWHTINLINHAIAHVVSEHIAQELVVAASMLWLIVLQSVVRSLRVVVVALSDGQSSPCWLLCQLLRSVDCAGVLPRWIRMTVLALDTFAWEWALVQKVLAIAIVTLC